jgi:hypothetical protein
LWTGIWTSGRGDDRPGREPGRCVDLVIIVSWAAILDLPASADAGHVAPAGAMLRLQAADHTGGC